MSLFKRHETTMPSGKVLIQEWYRGFEACKQRSEEMEWTIPVLAFRDGGGSTYDDKPLETQIEMFGADGYWQTQNIRIL